MSTFLSSELQRGQAFVDRWIFESSYLSTSGLGLFRIFLAAGMLLLTTPGQHVLLTFTSIAELPESQFTPPFGIMMLFSGFPTPEVVRLLEVALTIGLVALTVGYRTRIASNAVALLLLFLWGMQYSAGKIDHSSVILVPLLVLLSFTPWGESFSLDALRSKPNSEAARPARQPASYQWMGPFLALILGLNFLAAGIPKVLGGWLAPSSHALLNLVDLYSYNNDNPGFLVPLASKIQNGLFWESFDIVAAVWEVAFILAIFWLRSLRWALATAVIFHMANALILGIIYYPVLWLYALFIDWDAVLASRPVERLRTLGASMPASIARWYVAVPLIVVIALALYGLGSPILGFARLVLPDSTDIEFVMLTLATVGAVAYLVMDIRRLLLARSAQPPRAVAPIEATR